MSTNFVEKPLSENSIRQRKLLYGVGVNDANYPTQPKTNGIKSKCPYYARWRDMLQRGYSEKFKKRATWYLGVSVCPEWLVFSNFKSWMQSQQWEGRELDKDILEPNNKVYSPDTCRFIPKSLNLLLGRKNATGGTYPTGVWYCKKTNRFGAQITINNKRKNLGWFPRESMAHRAYLEEKEAEILKAISEQSDPLIISGLGKHLKILKGSFYGE